MCDCASILQDEAISLPDQEIASQTALAILSKIPEGGRMLRDDGRLRKSYE